MALWPVNLTDKDRIDVDRLRRRRKDLGLDYTIAQTIRDAIALAASADDETLRKGEL